MLRACRLRLAAALVTTLAAAGAAPAAAEPVSVKTVHLATRVGPSGDVRCDVVADLYKPASASRAHPVPAILTTNGFGGSKDDQATEAKAFAARGYAVLSYSGLGFGGSGCRITLDDRDTDGKAGSQLVSFLGGSKKATDGTSVDWVALDAVGSDGRSRRDDPRVGMLGGSYGGQVQFAVAGIDPRVDALIPIITWNDLSYALAPNNTSLTRGVSSRVPGVEKAGWVDLFFRLGMSQGMAHADVDPGRLLGGCVNFDPRACVAKAQMDATGAPDATTVAFARHASVAAFGEKIRVPTLLAQGQADTLFNLQESVATYDALRRRGVPVKLIWQSWGHSNGKAAPGELDYRDEDGSYESRTFLTWFDHYLKDTPAAPSLDFSFFRDWRTYQGDAAAAYGRTARYPVVARTSDLRLSGTDALVSDKAAVTPGAARLVTPAPGAPKSFTETSALDQRTPVSDPPGSTVRFSSAPLARSTDVIGVPSADVRIGLGGKPVPVGTRGAADGSPAGGLALFFKLYDVAPDGSVELVHRLISPVRVLAPGPVHVELPGIVHRFAAGHRMALAISGSDAAYRGTSVPTDVVVITKVDGPGVLHLPVAPASTYGEVVEAKPAARLGARQCALRRSLAVRVRAAYRSAARSTLVRVDGRVAARLGRRTRGRVALAGRVRSTVTVQVITTLRDGHRVTETLRHRVCG